METQSLMPAKPDSRINQLPALPGVINAHAPAYKAPTREWVIVGGVKFAPVKVSESDPSEGWNVCERLVKENEEDNRGVADDLWVKFEG